MSGYYPDISISVIELAALKTELELPFPELRLMYVVYDPSVADPILYVTADVVAGESI